MVDDLGSGTDATATLEGARAWALDAARPARPTPRPSFGSAADLARQGWAAVGILRAEWRTRRAVRPGLGQRLACLRRGFNTRSLMSYGAELPPAPGLYVSDWHEAALSKRPNRAYSLMLDDKLLFWLAVGRLTPRLAPLLGYLRAGWFYSLTGDGADKPVADLLRALPGTIVIKPVRGTLGRGIQIVAPAPDGLRVNGKPMSAGALAPLLGNQTFVVAPWIEQAGYSRTIFPGSLNSVRVMTLTDPESGEPFIPFAVHRFGADCTAPFDGFPNGGVIAPIEVGTGRLGTVVRFRQGEGRRLLDAHPDTGAPMTGVAIPGWQAICSELLALAARMPFLPYVGWDVVVTDDGFLINEGNSRPSLRVLQAAGGPLLRDDRVRRFYQFWGVI
jgi:hypothetical protein